MLYILNNQFNLILFSITAHVIETIFLYIEWNKICYWWNKIQCIHSCTSVVLSVGCVGNVIF